MKIMFNNSNKDQTINGFFGKITKKKKKKWKKHPSEKSHRRKRVLNFDVVLSSLPSFSPEKNGIINRKERWNTVHKMWRHTERTVTN